VFFISIKSCYLSKKKKKKKKKNLSRYNISMIIKKRSKTFVPTSRQVTRYGSQSPPNTIINSALSKLLLVPAFLCMTKPPISVTVNYNFDMLIVYLFIFVYQFLFIFVLVSEYISLPNHTAIRWHN
jgi:hypothetical protein